MNSPKQSDKRLLRQLVAKKCHGSLTEEEALKLSGLLESSDALRRHYWELIAVHSQLDWDLAAQDMFSVPVRSAAVESGRAGRYQGKLWYFASTFAAALMVVLLALPWWLSGESGEVARLPKAEAFESEVHARHAQLGQLSVLSPGTHWQLENQVNRTLFGIGDTLQVTTGAVRLTLETGASVIVESPARLQFSTNDRLRLFNGQVKIEVPEGAIGLSVETASMEIVDIGTVYSVNCSEEETAVVVFDGDVDVSMVQSGSGIGKKPLKRISAGEAASVDRYGTFSRIVSIRQSASQSSRVVPDQPMVIGEVKDNIAREKCLNFYEIIAGGMGEDAEAFVDRRHQWNGIDLDGMPRYLVGGDYVKTFNNDKVADGLEIDLTLEQPATLYILIDNRLAVPSWLREGFEDTGDEIGVDEVPLRPEKIADSQSAFPDETLGVGPGESIDQSFSVWKKVFPTPGTVSLGCNGNLKDSKDKELASMYGIIAVRLPQ